MLESVAAFIMVAGIIFLVLCAVIAVVYAIVTTVIEQVKEKRYFDLGMLTGFYICASTFVYLLF